MKRFIVFFLTMLIALSLCACSSSDYSNAVKLAESGAYKEAGDAFTALADYKDSAEKAKEMYYNAATAAMENEDYDFAEEYFIKADDFCDSSELLKEICYIRACASFAATDYDTAKKSFETISNYKDSADFIKQISAIELRRPFCGIRTAQMDISQSLTSLVGETVDSAVNAKLVLEISGDGRYSMLVEPDDTLKCEICDIIIGSTWDTSRDDFKEMADDFYDYVINDNDKSVPDFLNYEGQFVYKYVATEYAKPYIISIFRAHKGTYDIEGNAVCFYDGTETCGKGTLEGDKLSVTEFDAYPITDCFPLVFTK